MENSSEVICRQLGFPGVDTLLKEAESGGKRNEPVWLDQLKCLGNESMIESCSHGKWSLVAEECRFHKKDIQVLCSM